MARKPARLERAGALTPRDRIWAAIRVLQARGFSPIEVQFLANQRAAEPAHVDSIISYLQGLSRAEPPYTEPLEAPSGAFLRSELHQYRLVRDVGVEAPRVTSQGKPVTQGIANERMWAAMKALRVFDHAELASAASDAGHPVREQTAKTYCAFLCRAGYLALAAPNNGPHAKARYRFNRARNTGPRAPLVCRDKSVMDGNTGATVYTPGGRS